MATAMKVSVEAKEPCWQKRLPRGLAWASRQQVDLVAQMELRLDRRISVRTLAWVAVEVSWRQAEALQQKRRRAPTPVKVPWATSAYQEKVAEVVEAQAQMGKEQKVEAV
jgi:hypothetical protein